MRKGDMLEFRAGTRDLLGEYTDHFVRQHIVDQSLSDAGLEVSLANAIRLDRLDRVEIVPGNACCQTWQCCKHADAVCSIGRATI